MPLLGAIVPSDGAPAPLQRAGVAAMQLPPSYYEELAKLYHQKRECILQILDQVGIPYFVPQGAYYVLADISKFGYKTDIDPKCGRRGTENLLPSPDSGRGAGG